MATLSTKKYPLTGHISTTILTISNHRKESGGIRVDKTIAGH